MLQRYEKKTSNLLKPKLQNNKSRTFLIQL